MQSKDYEEYQTPSESDDLDVAEFDARVTTDGTLADAFHVFTGGFSNPAHTAPNTRFAPIQVPEIEVYTDDSAIDNTGNVKAAAESSVGSMTKGTKP
jgi:hypothetical protein